MLNNFIKAVDGLNIFGIRILKDGNLLAEKRFKPDAPVNQYSITKAFTGTAIGMAIDEGILTLDDKACDILYEHIPQNPQPKIFDITLRHLLTMSTGHAVGLLMPGQREKYKHKDWINYFFSEPLVYDPGEKFVYNNAASHVAAVMLQKKVGNMVDYLTPRLFEPLNFDSVSWGTCPLGYTFGGSELRIKTADMAKLGQLYLGNGVYNSKRLLSDSWVKEASTKKIATYWPGEGSFGYGYQFWISSIKGIYRAEGMMGQICLIIPQKNAVIAINSAEPQCNLNNNILYDILKKTIDF